MVESLRGLGYSPATAIADIIDNSIAAGASAVRIDFQWDGLSSRVRISDNGHGMTDAELERAMRLGDRNPLETRKAGDLGRFGLGLKTASFSQCRRLTVATERDGITSVLRWDLDLLTDGPDGGWHLLEGAHAGSEQFLDPFPEGHGTSVLWELMDRVTPAGVTEQDYLDAIDGVAAHLAMVFHRFIEKRSLRIFINDRPVEPWNPFLENLIETRREDVARFRGADSVVQVAGFILPHRDRLSDKVWQGAAGPEGWTAQQGFYVYRNERMLVSGGWLGLGERGRAWSREEAFRLARIRLDLPNTSDAAWKIDIRKSTARPPSDIRKQLVAYAKRVRENARKVFAFRGAPMARSEKGELIQAWVPVRGTAGSLRYRIDQKHPAIAAALDAAGDNAATIKAMLSIIEETVPVQQIWLDTAEGKETPQTRYAGAPPDEVVAVLIVMFRDLVQRKGMSPEEARAQLLRTEPFNLCPQHIAGLTIEPGK